MKRIAILLAATLAGLVQSATAAISVGAGGSGTLTFDTRPAATEWSTLAVGTSGSAVTTPAALDDAVQLLSATEIVMQVGTSGTTPPSVNAIARHNTTRLNLQSRTTTTTFTALMATLQNDSGGDVTALTVSYNLGLEVAAGSTAVEDIPGFRAYFSMTGLAGSWQNIPEFSTGTPGSLLAILNVGLWANGTPMYILWADDNGPSSDTAPNVEGAYQIDDFLVNLGGSGITITSPANGQLFPVGTPITITADGTMPGTILNVAFRANGVLIGNDNTAPYSVVYENAPLGTNELMATASDNLGNTVDSAIVRVVVRPNQAPTVAIDTPDANDILMVSNVTLRATAADSDGTVSQVQFFDGTTLWATDTDAPYAAIRSNVAPGVHTLVAVATDDKGLSSTSAPVTFTIVAPLPSLIPFGATWKYLDTGADLGTDWIFPGFDDSAWASGPAELGYGDDDEATVVSFGADAQNKFVTTYFRKSFSLADPASITSLALRVRRDDGVLVYLNGQLVLSDNMTNDLTELSYLTLALDAIEDTDLVATNLNMAEFPAGFLQADNVIAVEIHQAGVTSSDISFDLELIANPGANPPVLTLTAPTNGASYITPVSVAAAATAYDRDGAVTVSFFLDDVQFGTTDATMPFGRTADDVSPGTHVIKAVATDNTGLTTTAEVTINVIAGPVSVTLVESNSVWKYLDNGSDQGIAWQALAFDDTAWASGPAELGFGDNDEATVISQTDPLGQTNITFYFRQTFTVTGAGDYTNVVVRLRRDDGAIVYLNGTEVFRSNMPEGEVNFQTLAGGTIGSETTFFATNVEPGLLIEGQNILAVEVHQSGVTSSDVSFDLQLVGIKPPGEAGPRLTITPTGTGSATISWTPNTPGFRLEQAPTVVGPWTTSPSQVNGQTVTISTGNQFYRLANP